MCVHHYNDLAKFGLMHMVATNVCVWFDNVVKETLRNLNYNEDAENVTGRFSCGERSQKAVGD